MNRSLLVLALLLVPAPGYSMTASITSTTPPATAPAAPANSAIKAAAPAKSTAPSAASVTRPAASLAAPGVPMKSTAAASGRAGTASSKASAFMPSAATAAAPAPSNAAWTVGDSASMHRGTLEAINAGAGTFNVFGQKLSFNAQRVKVFNRDGKAGSVFAIKRGASIRFTLDPADAQHRRVAVIYVD